MKKEGKEYLDLIIIPLMVAEFIKGIVGESLICNVSNDFIGISG
jgi:hypothetical protein